ncbi:MAG: hypothetical protein ABH986_02765 [archaeon]
MKKKKKTQKEKESVKKVKKPARDPVKELEKLLTKPETQKKTIVAKEKDNKIEMKTNLKRELNPEEELTELINPRRGIDLKILKYLEELPKEQFTALLIVEPTNYSKINYELIRILLNHTKGNGLYITLNRSHEFMIETLKKEKIDTEKIFFIDAISRGTGKNVVETESVQFTESPRNLTELSVAIDDSYKRMEEKPKFLIFDSISTLLIYNDVSSVERFTHLIIGRLREWKIKGVLLMVKSEEQRGVVNSLSQFCDKILEIL